MSLVLAQDGRSRYQIVIPHDASPSVRYAATELQHFLKEISGASLPVVTDDRPASPQEILLGNTSRLQSPDLAVDFNKLGTEGYLLRTVGQRLLIAGGPARGTLYGVYGLLDDHLGCRWFTPTVSRIPKQSRLVIPPLDETRIPALEYREPFVIDCFDGDWAARNRTNGPSARLESKHGGKITYQGFVHTFHDLLPPEKYFDQHPEYYSEINGKRIKDYTQLCCTNDDVARLVTEAIRERIKAHPEATVFSVSQNDWYNPCQCSVCSALAKKEGANAAPVLFLVNRVAAALEAEFPDKIIDTLAYQWSRKPPETIRPRQNVVVRLCSIECCFSHGLDNCDSPENRGFRQDLEGWGRLTNRLWVWNYTTAFSNYYIPFPNHRVLRQDIRYLVKNHVVGLFEEDDYQSPHGELSQLDGYLMARFLWNPDYDEDTTINEFLQGVYGPAARPIRNYIDLLHDKVQKDHIHVHIGEGTRPPYLTADVLSRAETLWDQAEAAVAHQPDVLKRVQIARLSEDYAVIEHERTRPASAYHLQGDRYATTSDTTLQRAAARFFKAASQAGVTQLREGGTSLAEYRKQLEPQLGAPGVTGSAGLEAIPLHIGTALLHVVPDLGGRIISLKAGSTGPNLLSPGEPGDPDYPNAGGFVETVPAQAGAPVAPFKSNLQQDAGASVLTLTGIVAPGITLTRTISKSSQAQRWDSFDITTTVNRAAGTADPGPIRSSATLRLGPLGEQVYWAGVHLLPTRLSRGPAGSWEEIQLTPETAAETATSGLELAGPAGSINIRPGAIARGWVRTDARRGTVTVVFQALPGHPLTQHVTVRDAVVGPFNEQPSLILLLTILASVARSTDSVFARPDQLQLIGYDRWVRLEDDPTASTGQSDRMLTNHIEWCCHWPYSPADFEPGRAYDVYARLRVEKKGSTGEAFWAGIYDTAAGTGRGDILKNLADIPDSDWHLYKLGNVTPSAGQYLWCGPRANGQNVGAVWLDYFEMRPVK